MNPQFLPEDMWHGGFFELAIEVGERSNDRLAALVDCLWTFDRLEGCWLQSDCEPKEQDRILKGRSDKALQGHHLYGVASFVDGKRVACGCCCIREDGGIDWLDFYFPMGALSRLFPDVGAYPFARPGDHHPDKWLAPVEDWLHQLGLFLYESVDYRLGLVGFEISGNAYANELSTSGIPAERWMGYLWPTHGELTWYPRTKSNRPFTFEA